MKPFPLLPAWLTAIGALLVPAMALAHPGHDHSDIPSVIRHPFASLDHLLITAVVLAGVGAAALLAGWLARRAVWRWAGAGLMAAAVALMLI